jgi:hypothetical protein
MGKPEQTNNMVDFASLFDDDDLKEIGADSPEPAKVIQAETRSASKLRYMPEANNPGAFARRPKPTESSFPKASRYESQLHPLDNRAKSGLPPEFAKAREEVTGVYSTKLDESGNPRAIGDRDKTKLGQRSLKALQPEQHPTAQQNTNEIDPAELARRVEAAEREATMKELDEIAQRIERARMESERNSDEISQLKVKIASNLGIPVETPEGIPLNPPDVFDDLEILDAGTSDSEIPLIPELPVNPFGTEMSSQVEIIMETHPENDGDFLIIPPTTQKARSVPEANTFTDRPTSGTQHSIDEFFASIPAKKQK